MKDVYSVGITIDMSEDTVSRVNSTLTAWHNLNQSGSKPPQYSHVSENIERPLQLKTINIYI